MSSMFTVLAPRPLRAAGRAAASVGEDQRGEHDLFRLGRGPPELSLGEGATVPCVRTQGAWTVTSSRCRYLGSTGLSESSPLCPGRLNCDQLPTPLWWTSSTRCTFASVTGAPGL